MDVLYVNACVRPTSRTKRIADYLINKINVAHGNNLNIKELRLTLEDLKPLTNLDLLTRMQLAKKHDFSDASFRYAREYTTADIIVMAVPLWDMSFPAVFKTYIEHINVNGLAFKYDTDGKLLGLCKARQLFYVTTSGGPIFSESFGFGYIKALAQIYHGIERITCIKTEGLDIVNANETEIIQQTLDSIDHMEFT